MTPRALAFTFVGILDGPEVQWLYDRDDFKMGEVFEEFLASITPQSVDLSSTEQ